MLLEDFLKENDHNRRILITSDLNKGPVLLRRFEAKYKCHINNVLFKTLDQLTESLYQYIQSQHGFMAHYEIIENFDAAMLLRNTIIANIDNLKYFHDEKMMNIATVQEIYNKCVIIRENGWTGAESKETNDRIDDLKYLISKFEEALEKRKLMDHTALNRYDLNMIRSWDDPKERITRILAAKISYIKEDTDTLTGLEKDLLELYSNAADPVVSIIPVESVDSSDNFTNCRGKAEFYKGYGSFNETNYIAYDILKNNIPFGDTEVLYSSQAQLSSIISALEGNGIRMNILSSHPISHNPYINLVRRIINWALTDYSEKALENIFSSSVIKVVTDQHYFDHVIRARERRENGFSLGWGFARNVEFIDHEQQYYESIKDDISKEKKEAALEALKLHRSLIDIFADTGDAVPSCLFERIFSFVKACTFKNGEDENGDYKIAIDKLQKLQKSITFEERSLSQNEALNFIDRLLTDLSTTGSISTDAVVVRNMNDWIISDRTTLYITGLSLKDLQVSSTQSSILSDDELINYIGDGYKPTIENEYNRRSVNLHRTVALFDGKRIIFGYSSYDMTGFYENNASGFFREALRNLSDQDIANLPEFIYGNPKSPVEHPQTAETGKISIDKRILDTSSSSLEVFLQCPKRYAFEKIFRIPKENFYEKDFSIWLDAMNQGSFFHAIVAEYVQKHMIQPKLYPYPDIEEASVCSIARDLKAEFLSKLPTPFEALTDTEIEDLSQKSVTYLKRLRQELNGTDWKVLAVELPFYNSEYAVTSYNGNDYTFHIHKGIIDRIDYLIDKNSGIIKLRICDYKTGQKKYKGKEKDRGALIQYAVYCHALEDGYHSDNSESKMLIKDYLLDKIACLENDADLSDYRLEFECFEYIFPFEEKDDQLKIVIKQDDLETVNLTRLKSVLTAIEDTDNYPDRLVLVESVSDYSEKYSSDDPGLDNLLKGIGNIDKTTDKMTVSEGEKSGCRYCDYSDLCINRKAGAISE